MEPPQDAKHTKMIKLTSKMGNMHQKKSFLKSIEWTQKNQIFTKNKEQESNKKMSCKRKR